MHDFDILSDAFFADPYPTLARMRKEAPCWYDPRLDAHVITRFQDIERVLQDDQRFSARRVGQFGRGAPDEVREQLEVYSRELGRWLLFLDPPLHTSLRTRLGTAVGPQLLPRIKTLAKTTVLEAIFALEGLDDPDLIRDFAVPVPTRVLAQLLGVPRAEIERFKDWTTDVFALIGAGVATAEAVLQGHRGVTGLRDYVLALMAERRAQPREDIISALVTERPGSAPVSDDDLMGLCMAMIVAGHETTTNLIGNALHATLQDDHCRAWIQQHDGLSDDDIDEFVRYDGPVFSLIRRTREEITLGGELIREGACVFNMLNAGNRDSRRFRNPDRIDFARPKLAHLGFGTGIHSCVGNAIARLVAREAIAQFTMSYRHAALRDTPTRIRNMSIRGFATLPVVLNQP